MQQTVTQTTMRATERWREPAVSTTLTRPRVWAARLLISAAASFLDLSGRLTGPAAAKVLTNQSRLLRMLLD